MTILGAVGDHPMDGDHLWQMSTSVSFVSKVLVLNSKSVVHFRLVWWVTILRLVGDHPWGGGGPSYGW